MKRAALLLLVCGLLNGCVGIQIGTGLRPLHHTGKVEADPDHTWRVDITNWAITLFGGPTLFAGDIDHPGRVAWFTETVNSEGMTRLLSDVANNLGAVEIVDVQTTIFSSWAFGPFWFTDGLISATLVGPPDIQEIPPLVPVSER